MTTPDHPEVCGWMLLQAGVITPLEELAFLDDEGHSPEIPPSITTTNAHHPKLFDLKPGETVSEDIARKSSKTT